MDRAEEDARKMVGQCKPGYLIVYDRENDCVYYQSSPSEIVPTDYREEHIEIAHSLPTTDPDYIEWDRMNSELAGNERDYYAARGR